MAGKMAADLRIFWHLHAVLVDLLRVDLGQLRGAHAHHGGKGQRMAPGRPPWGVGTAAGMDKITKSWDLVMKCYEMLWISVPSLAATVPIQSVSVSFWLLDSWPKPHIFFLVKHVIKMLGNSISQPMDIQPKSPTQSAGIVELPIGWSQNRMDAYMAWYGF